ncbi:MAG: radical SAM protein [Nitrospirota bacterium]|nr:radical SAM protein [Nitrospirota bacterium]
MKLKIHEVNARSILSKSGIPGMKYCVNPYTGCAHACVYCYATFMKRFTGHTEPWGSFVDVKINAPELLRRQLKRAEKGSIMLSSVTDAYQPAEAKYRLTRSCLEVISLFRFPVSVLTKSPLVVRDIDILSKIKDAEVGLTITTDDDNVRKIFEPHAPPIAARIDALKKLHAAGINTYVFIGPVLPMDPDRLAKLVRPYADRFLIDRMNYADKTKWLYKKHGMEKWLDDGFVEKTITRLRSGLKDREILLC